MYFKRCKMDGLTNALKRSMYEELNLEFNMNEDKVNYESIYNAIELGDLFKEFCEFFELDSSIVERYTKKYVLHLIFEESAAYIRQEADMIRSFSDEPLFSTTIGEILENLVNEEGFINTNHFNEYLGKTLDHKIDNKESKFQDPIDNLSKEVSNNFYPFTEKVNTFYPLYFKFFVNKKRPIKPRHWNKEVIPDDVFNNIIIHHKQYNDLLGGYSKDINPTKHIFEFEQDTNILFFLKLTTILPIDKINKLPKSERENYLKIISSFTLIEDLQFKLYFIDQLISENNEVLFLKGIQGYNRLFAFLFLYIPFLTGFIKEQIKIPHGTLTVKSDYIEKEEASNLKAIKKNMYFYHILKTVPCYSVSELTNELTIDVKLEQLLDTEYKDVYFSLYKKIAKIKKIRKDLSEEIIDNCLWLIKRDKQSLNKLFEYEAYDFMKSGKKLALVKKNDILFGEFFFYKDHQQLKEKLKRSNINLFNE